MRRPVTSPLCMMMYGPQHERIGMVDFIQYPGEVSPVLTLRAAWHGVLTWEGDRTLT